MNLPRRIESLICQSIALSLCTLPLAQAQSQGSGATPLKDLRLDDPKAFHQIQDYARSQGMTVLGPDKRELDPKIRSTHFYVIFDDRGQRTALELKLTSSADKAQVALATYDYNKTPGLQFEHALAFSSVSLQAGKSADQFVNQLGQTLAGLADTHSFDQALRRSLGRPDPKMTQTLKQELGKGAGILLMIAGTIVTLAGIDAIARSPGATRSGGAIFSLGGTALFAAGYLLANPQPARLADKR